MSINMKKEIFVEIPLIKYITDNISQEEFKKSCKTNIQVIEKIGSLLKDKSIKIIGNHNGHNYEVGSTILLSESKINTCMSVEANNKSNFYPKSISFSGLIRNGNNIKDTDISVLAPISSEEYITGLELLREIIEIELNFTRNLDISKENREELFSEALITLLDSPFKISNHYFFVETIRSYKDEIDAYKERKKIFENSKHIKMFLNL